MASINYAAKEISVKVVYYGPGLSGKTTNLQVIHQRIPNDNKSNMVSLATETDRTLFFDFLPLDLGKIKGFSTKFQLYTVPGQVYYNATRKLVLRGVDGVVFVVDSSSKKMDENLESFQNLQDNLAEYGYQKENIPIILQYNKRDLPDAVAIEQLQSTINTMNYPWNEAIAVKSKGVFESLKKIGKIVIDQLNKKYSRPSSVSRPSSPVPPRPKPTVAPPVQPATRPTPPQQQIAPEPPKAPPPPPPQQQTQNPFISQVTPPPPPSTPPPASTQPIEFDSPFESGSGTRPAQEKPVADISPEPEIEISKPTSTDYMGQDTIDLEPMNNINTPPEPSIAPPPPKSDQKTDLDLEIERYQREIEMKQRSASPSNPPSDTAPEAPISYDQTFEPQTPSQPQPTGNPTTGGGNTGDYDVYDLQSSQETSLPPNLQSSDSDTPPQQSNSDTPMYFTSVNTERPRKKIKKPINPKQQGSKGTLFSKLFGRKESDE